MRLLLWIAVVVGLAAHAHAHAADRKPPEVTAQARAFLDRADAAYNAHDLRALYGMIDPAFIGGGPSTSDHWAGPVEVRRALERDLGKGLTLKRDSLAVQADESGNVVWYLAEYTLTVPQKGSTAMHVPVRESGALVKRADGWKFAMIHLSSPEPDDEPAAPPEPRGKK